MKTKTRISALTLSLLLGAGVISACSPADDRTAGERVDDGVAATEQRMDQAQDKAREGAAEVREGAADAGQAVGNAAERAGDAVSDVAITAAVKTRLATDPDLSALAINVDTVDGVVTLAGPAPNQAAMERATQLASASDGVVRVENRLTIQQGG
jgi:hyperosmotically inducible protein